MVWEPDSACALSGMVRSGTRRLRAVLLLFANLFAEVKDAKAPRPRRSFLYQPVHRRVSLTRGLEPIASGPTITRSRTQRFHPRWQRARSIASPLGLGEWRQTPPHEQRWADDTPA